MRKSFWLVILFTLALSPLSAQTIQVSSPNGGEPWALNTPQNITWNFTNAGSVKVDIILRNSVGKVGVIKSQVALSAGSWPWPLVGKLEDGTMVAPGIDYIVRIRAGSTCSDDSDQPFSITGTVPPSGPASITVTSPNGGENWASGQSRNVTWTAANWTGTVQLSLTQNGEYKGIIAKNLPSGQGAFPWPVGMTDKGSGGIGGGYRVLVSRTYPGLHLPQAALVDQSDGDFSIGIARQLAGAQMNTAIRLKPDLIVCKWGPGQLTKENLCQPALACFNLTVKIFNIGNTESKECWLKVAFNGGGGESRKIAPINPGEAIVANFLINTHLDGSFSDNYTFWIDEKNDVDEANEENNILVGVLSLNKLEYAKCSDGKAH